MPDRHKWSHFRFGSWYGTITVSIEALNIDEKMADAASISNQHTSQPMNNARLGPKDYLQFLLQVAPELDEEFVRGAENFEYGQWELPFEAVLLNLLKSPSAKGVVDIELAEKLAKEADLMEEGVLTPDTWQRFMHWYEAQ